jgi:hypothetical protein
MKMLVTPYRLLSIIADCRCSPDASDEVARLRKQVACLEGEVSALKEENLKNVAAAGEGVRSSVSFSVFRTVLHCFPGVSFLSSLYDRAFAFSLPLGPAN